MWRLGAPRPARGQPRQVLAAPRLGGRLLAAIARRGRRLSLRCTAPAERSDSCIDPPDVVLLRLRPPGSALRLALAVPFSGLAAFGRSPPRRLLAGRRRRHRSRPDDDIERRALPPGRDRSCSARAGIPRRLPRSCPWRAPAAPCGTQRRSRRKICDADLPGRGWSAHAPLPAPAPQEPDCQRKTPVHPQLLKSCGRAGRSLAPKPAAVGGV